MIEPKAGIFLGRMTARIREELWNKSIRDCRVGACQQFWSCPGEQGFQMRSHGEGSRTVVEFEGLYLVEIPVRERKM